MYACRNDARLMGGVPKESCCRKLGMLRKDGDAGATRIAIFRCTPPMGTSTAGEILMAFVNSIIAQLLC